MWKWLLAPAGSEGSGTGAGEPNDDTQDGPPPSQSSTTLSPDDVRNSPEYKAQAAESRRLARELGAAKAAETAARTAAETQRAAAEAQAREAQAAELRGILGDDGIAEWEAIADLAATDQKAAAQRFATLLGKAQAKSQPPAGGAPAGGSAPPAQPPANGGAGMFPNRGVDANLPIGQPGSDNSLEAVEREAEARFTALAARQQGSLQERSRFTGKDRREGIMDHLVAGYMRGFRERDERNARR